MHDHPSSSIPGAVPRRFDVYLGATAALAPMLIALFMLTQAVTALRVDGDARFEVVLWLVEIEGVAAISFFVRPCIAHVRYAMNIGLDRGASYPAPAEDHPRQLAVRRVAWRLATAAAVAFWSATVAIEAASDTGALDLHGSNLFTVVEVTSAAATVGALVRLIGPGLTELDDVFRAACDYARRCMLPSQRRAQSPLRPERQF